jgi:NTP pyrophosphatase (non-canonical NTP hydrolase)
MATSSKTKSAANAEVEARSALANRMKDAQHVIGPTLAATLQTQAQLINTFMQSQGFWESDNTGEKIALMHSELSEALEADRKNLDAEHIPGFTGVEEELADVIIRILDFAGHHQLRLGEALSAKVAYNLTRPFKHGKAY